MPGKEELRYSSEHEWVHQAGASEVLVGITEYAVDKLGDVVYVDLPPVDSEVIAETVCGEIESTKSVSELYAPVSGRVTEVNPRVADDPGLVNRSPEDEGWLFRVQVSGEGPLMDWAAYREHTRE